MSGADLHSHSLVSDGRLTPAELVRLAKSKGVEVLALTDHDSVNGVAEALAEGRACGLSIIPGVEISADYEPGTMHILGLGIDPQDQGLLAELEGLQQARRDRNPEVFRRLRSLGLSLEYSAIEKRATGGQIGRPHFAQALVDAGVVSSFKEAFDKYLGKGKPAYVAKRRLPAPAAIKAIHAAGGVSVLAHPVQLGLDGAALEAKIAELKAQGLDAVEAYHSDHSPELEMLYLDLAARLGLRVSGGSDFHGITGGKVELGRPTLPMEMLPALLAGVRFK